ncbi:MAG: cellobiose phosphorylase [Anaerolineales bacterium]|nr:cellobiose phosphorylase [Anaerolineales bacterium]
MTQSWEFTDDRGTFVLKNPHQTSYLYFPLVNETRMMSVVTPTLQGDAKTDQNHFLLAPVSVEDLHNSRAGRNFWVYQASWGAWSATGNAAAQIAASQTSATGKINPETVCLHAGMLWHRITRQSDSRGLRAEITSFVPPTVDQVELMQVILTNTSADPITITPTAAIPLYGRSADNLRDHRHVTSLLHRIITIPNGVVLQPTLSFDERGHLPNHVAYCVLGASGDGAPPVGFFPLVEDFIGEGGSLDWPLAVVNNLPPTHTSGASLAGYEAMGTLRFADITLPPGESATYLIIMGITSSQEDPAAWLSKYGNATQFAFWLKENQTYWQERIQSLQFHTQEPRYDGWLRWVSLQPILRRLFGNSFLPYHDYGRGGRGWRDLWQDCLAILIMDGQGVGDLLFDYFAGVRIDGSNATIIGTKPGEFLADRNNIARVWMDHGAWPYLTTRLYLDQTGDLEFLLRPQAYFKDHHTHRARKIDPQWQPDRPPQLCTAAGEVYYGTILEHLLVQGLTAFYHVGAHNNIRLENADWNDGMDMAAKEGESVAFTALYANNLHDLADLLGALESRGLDEVIVARELLLLTDTLSGADFSAAQPDYTSPEARINRLQAYFGSTSHTISGDQVRLKTSALAADLRIKADYLVEHLRRNEWIEGADGHAWFNGYYDNDGQRVEGTFKGQVRMTLTGQVFALMGNVATQAQAAEVIRSVEHYLQDAQTGGFRLNTDFGEVLTNLGRCFGFAYGHKENGAMFTHMTVMYAYALYKRGFAQQGWRILDGLYRHCQDFTKAHMYPGLPEYTTPRGRGVYPYLTGSAAWYLLALLTQSFGVRGSLGDLILAPALVRSQFNDASTASVDLNFADHRIRVVYHNPQHLDFGAYQIGNVQINGSPVHAPPIRQHTGVTLPRQIILNSGIDRLIIDVTLVPVINSSSKPD